MIRTIAIDGPAASGKTVVGRKLAQRLAFWFLDTGIMYRAVTWLALERGVSPDDARGLTELAQSVQIQPVSMDGDSVEMSGQLSGPELQERRVDNNVSDVSRHPCVRRVLVEQQRNYAQAVLSSSTDGVLAEPVSGIVMIGRDIGTVVLPEADHKIFLTASAGQRAIRRCREMLERGQTASVSTIEREIKARDAIDSSREDSPLRPATDAWQLDSSDLNIEGVVSSILDRIGAADVR